MKFKLLLLCLLFSMTGLAQYELTKTEKQIKESYRSPDLLQKTQIDDSTVLLIVLVNEFQKTYILNSRKDSCTMQVVGFIDRDYQLMFMKDLNEKWISEGENKWKTYLHGGTVHAFFTQIEKLDAVLFRLEKQ